MSGAIINSGGHPKMPRAVMPASLPPPSVRPLPPFLAAAPRTRHSSLYFAPTLPGLYLSIPLWLCLKPSASYTILVTFLFLPPFTVILFLASGASILYDRSRFTTSRFFARKIFTYASYSMLFYSAFFFWRKRGIEMRSKIRGSKSPSWFLGTLALADARSY